MAKKAQSTSAQATSAQDKRLVLAFEDASLFTMICGQHNQTLAKLEHILEIKADSFGNEITLQGPKDSITNAARAIQALYKKLAKADVADESVVTDFIADMMRQAEFGASQPSDDQDSGPMAVTWKKKIVARTPNQKDYFRTLNAHEVVFGLGPAGTGKTYMAVAMAVDALKKRLVERIVLSRPAVEAGERLG
ncbi:MAG: PhoH family protein, partial [Candidatus Puniceispirillaceae bacterium]